MAFRYPPADTPVADQFHTYTRSAGTLLVYASSAALLVGLIAGSLNVWTLHGQFSDSGATIDTWRFYAVQFLQSFAIYALMAAVLFAGGMIVNCLAWFYSALSADFDDLYEDSDPGDGAPTAPPANPSEWTRPIGTD